MARPGQMREQLELAVRENFLAAMGRTAGNGGAGADGSSAGTAPHGCKLWAGYLVELERLRQYGGLTLTAEEAEGLMLLERVRAEMRERYTPCPKCGLAVDKEAPICPKGHVLGGRE